MIELKIFNLKQIPILDHPLVHYLYWLAFVVEEYLLCLSTLKGQWRRVKMHEKGGKRCLRNYLRKGGICLEVQSVYLRHIYQGLCLQLHLLHIKRNLSLPWRVMGLTWQNFCYIMYTPSHFKILICLFLLIGLKTIGWAASLHWSMLCEYWPKTNTKNQNKQSLTKWTRISNSQLTIQLIPLSYHNANFPIVGE